MSKTILFLTILIAGVLNGQTLIKGTVKSGTGEVLPSANIFIKDTYDGNSSDLNGNFSFETEEAGDVILVAKFIGYKAKEIPLKLDKKEIIVDIVLEPEATELKTVVISAGAFEASDEKKAVVMRPLDIVTTAGANGDIYSALTTLPGTQQVGEQEGLFVRGGSAAETKTFIDDMLVQNPYFSSVPDLPSRGRFSPFLFKGTIFSTGGYSAQYGQALSSALILKSQDLAPDTRSSISVLAAGVGAFHSQRWENTSVGVSLDYFNLGPYFKAFPQRTEWDKSPETASGTFIFRHKTSKTGMLKAYSTYNASDVALLQSNLDVPGTKTRFGLKNKNFYFNSGYSDILGDDLTMSVGYSFTVNNDDILIDAVPVDRDNDLNQVKATFQKGISTNLFVTFGGEYQHLNIKNSLGGLSAEYQENYSAAFVEADFFITNNLAARAGLRFDNSNVINKQSLAPRLSLAWKLSDLSTLNFAYGRFYQLPDAQYLNFSRDYQFENATHYIANYQILADKRVFRVEFYYKQYDNLVKKIPNGFFYDNSGTGYAKGIDLFWRDSESFKYVDYWLSYSWLDTKRDYREFPTLATPTFAAEHTASLVYKHYVPDLNTYLGFTYRFATGRPYFNPNNPVFNGDKTREYHDLSFNGSYLTNLWGYFTIVYLSVSNLLGYENIFSYRYSTDGTVSQEVIPPVLRSVFFGFFVSLDYK
ncbi:MAG: TonB-dependent receptor [Ignavibacteriaceae bacterium]|nr:TonB-dependent receptor [Ignavibacteriaceae bacterium]